MSGIGGLLLRAIILGLVVALAASSGRAANSPDATAREAWQYTTKGGTLTFRKMKPKEWVVEQPDGRELVYDELDRTDQYIELRNRSTKLHFRLHADRGYWRRETDAEWNRWVIGAWVSRPRPPGAGKTSSPVNRRNWRSTSGTRGDCMKP